MRDTAQLPTAIAELQCVRTGPTATLEELTALTIAQASIDKLPRSCVED
ncbi:hypothetical protein LXM50_09515 [Microbacterium sp. Au-Mic1]|nr:hypothetical protein [Microbacterium sp. Au-Mic1]MCE4026212.1 hypothetical protein [Microbacterium sp. Au-Mic1]